MDRVDGTLALSRALGDYGYKKNGSLKPEEQAVTAYPDIDIKTRQKDDEFIMVACDGIWDCLSNEECIQKVNKYVTDLKP